MNDRFRILVVDDHKAFLDGLRAMLNSAPDLEIVGEANSGTQAVEMALSLQPDIILMDIQMPRGASSTAVRTSA